MINKYSCTTDTDLSLTSTLSIAVAESVDTEFLWAVQIECFASGCCSAIKAPSLLVFFTGFFSPSGLAGLFVVPSCSQHYLHSQRGQNTLVCVCPWHKWRSRYCCLKNRERGRTAKDAAKLCKQKTGHRQLLWMLEAAAAIFQML